MTEKSKLKPKLFFTSAQARSGRGNSGYLNVEYPLLARMDLRRYFFTQRCPRLWKSLPAAVKQAGTVNGFKAAYDAYMGHRRL